MPLSPLVVPTQMVYELVEEYVDHQKPTCKTDGFPGECHCGLDRMLKYMGLEVEEDPTWRTTG